MGPPCVFHSNCSSPFPRRALRSFSHHHENQGRFLEAQPWRLRVPLGLPTPRSLRSRADFYSRPSTSPQIASSVFFLGYASSGAGPGGQSSLVVYLWMRHPLQNFLVHFRVNGFLGNLHSLLSPRGIIWFSIRAALSNTNRRSDNFQALHMLELIWKSLSNYFLILVFISPYVTFLHSSYPADMY